jgi:hypothetical protein
VAERHAVITGTRQAGPDHRVVTVVGGRGTYRRAPCEQCPWRIDQTGKFPAEAFRHSADTAYDMADHVFACHMSGAEKPAVCAGFLLRGAAHNLAARLMLARGEIGSDVTSDMPVHDSYRAMAEANGVSRDDPALSKCRDG